MPMKWGLGLVAMAAVLAAAFSAPDDAPSSQVSATFKFDLADARAGDADAWVALMDNCETADASDERFQHYGAGELDLYFDARDHVLCKYWDERAVTAYVMATDLPATHQFVLAGRDDRTRWSFGPVPRER